jgi:hypothetical protein
MVRLETRLLTLLAAQRLDATDIAPLCLAANGVFVRVFACDCCARSVAPARAATKLSPCAR